MTYKFRDIVDVERVQALMDKLWKASGIPTGIIDVDGTVLVATGWQDLCSLFHRQNPETDARCRESDAYLAKHLRLHSELPECGYVEYHCRNGMIDIAIPIVIEGQHLANIFLGQFFYEPPEEEFFVEQALRCGFDKEAYLEALKKVPIFSRDKVSDIVQFNSGLVDLLTCMGVEKLRQLEAQRDLLESEEKFRNLFECSNDAVYILDPDGDFIEINQVGCEQFGFSRQELLQKTMPELLAPSRVGNFSNRVQEIQKKGRLIFETVQRRKDGAFFSVEVSIRPFVYQGRPALLGTSRDISQRKQAEEKLRASLKEKEVLLQEIHHRVKNNLQVVSSLLFLQSQRFSDPELAASFLESQNRICSMALAHEQLYQSKNFAEISLRDYVESLVSRLRGALAPTEKIACQLEVDEIALDIEKVIPCGLLITELLSNAYKHAFVDGRSGNIIISIKCIGRELVLVVADDGVGLPVGFDYRQATTLGLQLLTALASQINGSLELEQEKGTLFRVRFSR